MPVKVSKHSHKLYPLPQYRHLSHLPSSQLHSLRRQLLLRPKPHLCNLPQSKCLWHKHQPKTVQKS